MKGFIGRRDLIQVIIFRTHASPRPRTSATTRGLFAPCGFGNVISFESLDHHRHARAARLADAAARKPRTATRARPPRTVHRRERYAGARERRFRRPGTDSYPR